MMMLDLPDDGICLRKNIFDHAALVPLPVPLPGTRLDGSVQ